MGGSAGHSWLPRTTVNDDFLFPVVPIDMVLIPNFLHRAVYRDIKSDGNLIHLVDVLCPKDPSPKSLMSMSRAGALALIRIVTAETLLPASLFKNPLFSFVLQHWPSHFVPSKTFSGLLYLARHLLAASTSVLWINSF